MSTAWCREASSDSNISTSHVNDFPHQAAPETGKCELARLIANVFGNIRTPSFFQLTTTKMTDLKHFSNLRLSDLGHRGLPQSESAPWLHGHGGGAVTCVG